MPLLRLPIELLGPGGRRLRGYVFTFASILNWCLSRTGRSFNPRIDQITRRAGLSERAVKKHLRELKSVGVIERTDHHTHPTITTITEGIRAYIDRTPYLEVPVALVMDMGIEGAKVGLIARCVNVCHSVITPVEPKTPSANAW